MKNSASRDYSSSKPPLDLSRDRESSPAKKEQMTPQLKDSLAKFSDELRDIVKAMKERHTGTL